MITRTIAAACVLVLSSQAMAEKGEPVIDRNNLSIGGGLSLNSVSGPIDDELGFQFFAAYHLEDFNLMQYVDTSIELGYMDYGFSGADSGGLWINAVIDGAIQDDLGWVARLGLDLGDDDGLMVGGGAALYVDPRSTLRFEYVIRDNIDSLQVNYVHRL